MLVKDALISNLQLSVDDNLVSKVLLDNDILEDQTYTKNDNDVVDKMSIDILLAAWTSADVSEGGYSIRLDREAIKSRLLFLAKKTGRNDIDGFLNPSANFVSKW
jgi:hypothetical protein